MVDAAASMRARQAPTADISPTQRRVEVSATTGEALEAYARLVERGLAAPAQSAAWISGWVANVEADALLATIHVDDQPALSIGLEVSRSGPLTVCGFMGGRHANGNFPATDPALLAELSPAAFLDLFESIHRAWPDIDLLKLERLAPQLGDVRNPLLRLDHYPSPNVALALSLDGGFDAVLNRTSAKRKRKKHRSQTRKFDAAGGFRRIRASTPEEVDRLLNVFFEMKEQRFRKMGIANAFGDPAVRRFFRKLFAQSLGPSPSFVLHGLEVGGKLRAITGSSVCGDRLICEFGAIAEDDMAHASPGDFLFFENICEAARSGFAVYDFSVGDEPYKRLWCNIETTQYDVIVPFTLKGRVFAGALRAATAAKAAVKNNPALWNLFKRLRKGAAGAESTSTDGD